VLKRTYFMAVIDGVFCLDAHVWYTNGRRYQSSVITHHIWVQWDCGHL